MKPGSEKTAYAYHLDCGVLQLVHLECQGVQKDTGQWQRSSTGGRNMRNPTVMEDVTSILLDLQV